MTIAVGLRCAQRQPTQARATSYFKLFHDAPPAQWLITLPLWHIDAAAVRGVHFINLPRCSNFFNRSPNLLVIVLEFFISKEQRQRINILSCRELQNSMDSSAHDEP